MKRRIISVVLVLAVCAALCISAYAAEEQLVMDEASLLTNSEKAALNDRLQQISTTHGAQVVVMTVKSLQGTYIDRFINDTYDQLGLGYGENRDGVLLVVCMDPREYRILTNGMANQAIGDDEIDIICDIIVSDLSDGNYADAFESFADECEFYINGHLNGFPFDVGATLVFSLVIGVVIGLITVFVMKSKLKSVRRQNRAHEYVKNDSFEVTTRLDLFLYRTVSRRRKAQNNSSSSGSSRSSRSVGGGKF